MRWFVNVASSFWCSLDAKLDILSLMQWLIQSPLKKEQAHSPTRKELTQSPSREKLCNASNDENVQPLVRKAILPLSSNFSEDGNNDIQLGLHNSHSQFPAQDVKNSSRRKRITEEPVPGDADKIRRIKRNPNAHKSQGSDMEFTWEHSNGSDNVREMVGGDTTTKHWTDVSIHIVNLLLSHKILS